MKEVQMTEFNKPFPELKIKKSKAAAARILLKSLTYSFALFGLLFIYCWSFWQICWEVRL